MIWACDRAGIVSPGQAPNRGVDEEVGYLEVLLADLDDITDNGTDLITQVQSVRNRVNRLINQLLTQRQEVNLLEKIRNLAFRQIGAWEGDGWPVPDDSVGKCSNGDVTDFGEPIFIHASMLQGRWEQVVDSMGLEGTDFVLRINGTTPMSMEPLTVDIGIRGAVLDVIGSLLACKFKEWDGKFADGDAAKFKEWENDNEF